MSPEVKDSETIKELQCFSAAKYSLDNICWGQKGCTLGIIMGYFLITQTFIVFLPNIKHQYLKSSCNYCEWTTQTFNTHPNEKPSPFQFSLFSLISLILSLGSRLPVHKGRRTGNNEPDRSTKPGSEQLSLSLSSSRHEAHTDLVRHPNKWASQGVTKTSVLEMLSKAAPHLHSPKCSLYFRLGYRRHARGVPHQK